MSLWLSHNLLSHYGCLIDYVRLVQFRCIIVGTDDYSSRYDVTACPTNTAQVQTDADRLLTSWNAVKAKVQALRNHLDDGNSSNNNDVKEKFNAAATVANNWQTGKWQTFIDAVRSTIDLVSDTTNGLLYQLDCSRLLLSNHRLDRSALGTVR